MKRFFILCAIVCFVLPVKVSAWNNFGHSTIASLANRHLTQRARTNIEKYLGGYSILSCASWMDYNRKYPPYDFTNGWHVDYWTNENRTDKDGNPLPPASLSNVERICREMTDFREMDDSTVLFNIRVLTHLVGDMHCPVHVDYPKNRPMKVKINGKNYAYHKMWDGYIMGTKHPNISPSYFAELLDNFSQEELSIIQAGTPQEWYEQSVIAANDAMNLLPRDKVCTMENYFNEAEKIGRRQMTRAGLRLAKVLNEIFDK
ncbi:MAG: S1/P1 nuclease [Alistipes sp.]|nr:S1/P1 nuclease [Candidatus Alistipes equi]